MSGSLNQISLISDSLKSKEIIDYLNQWNIDKMQLLKLVIESKIAFDQLSANPDNSSYFSEIEESVIYETAGYSELIMVISTLGEAGKSNLQQNNLINKFYLFHKMLYRTANLVANLLSNQNNTNTAQNPSNTIVNPLFANTNKNPPVTGIPNPLNTYQRVAEPGKNESIGNNYSNTPPAPVRDASKLFLIKEQPKEEVIEEQVIQKSKTNTDNFEANMKNIQTNMDNENEMSLGSFLKSLSGL